MLMDSEVCRPFEIGGKMDMLRLSAPWSAGALSYFI